MKITGLRNARDPIDLSTDSDDDEFECKPKNSPAGEEQEDCSPKAAGSSYRPSKRRRVTRGL